MKAVLISCFNYYDNRLKYVEQFLRNIGYDVIYITSDFNHIDKVRYSINRPNTIQVQVKTYYKNLSAQRLLSHYFFAKDAFKEVKKINPDLLYVMLPPNFLARYATKYKRENKVKLVYDIYDLWPETFPSITSKKMLAAPFKYWRRLRDDNLNVADVIFTECGLYQEKLNPILEKMNTDILYLAKEKSKLGSDPQINASTVNVCYLGSINSIIDIPSIVQLLEAINKLKPVTLHIIGDGEKREQFIEDIKKVGVNVKYYGKIYEDEKKKEIFDKCSFGINMMRSTVCVGLTMKSIDYFQAGLPILNNIQADTSKLVEKYNIGFNVTSDNLEYVSRKVASVEITELRAMRENTAKVFNSLFSLEAFNKKLNDWVKYLT
ncbi:glycosyltransferase [Bacillus sp. 22-7]|uniref:glycosyltransferase n=1 Tax=Bacillus sp. 22-7 TaxID=2709707 RepID=UPI0011009E5E|nr:glycosyltransferase [Bacillus sp. 22-7]